MHTYNTLFNLFFILGYLGFAFDEREYSAVF